MSREALSLDISHLVSRVVSGESIDTAERGAALAAKYPDLGMSGVLIGQAIERAAGMVGMIRNAPEPAKPFPRAVEAPAAVRSAPAKGASANGATATGHPRKPVSPQPPLAVPPLAKSIDDELAAAIDAEIGNLVSGQTAKPAAPTQPAAAAKPKSESRTRVAPALAKVEVRASTALRTNGETRVPAAPAVLVAAAQATVATEEPPIPAPQGSILSSFRRALFRT